MHLIADVTIIQAPNPDTEMVYLEYIPVGLAALLIVLTVYLFIR